MLKDSVAFFFSGSPDLTDKNTAGFLKEKCEKLSFRQLLLTHQADT